MASASHVRYSSLSLSRSARYPATARAPTPPPSAPQRTRARPPRRAHSLARAPRHAGPTSCLFPAPLLLYKKIASRNAQLGTIYIYRTQITVNTSKLACKKKLAVHPHTHSSCMQIWQSLSSSYFHACRPSYSSKLGTVHRPCSASGRAAITIRS